MIFVNDTAGRTLYHDPVWKHLTGQDVEQALGIGWLDRIYIEDRALVEDTHYGAIEAASEYNIRYRLLTPDDQPRWVCVGAQASSGPPGQKFIGFLGSLAILPDAAAGTYKAYGHISLNLRYSTNETSVSADARTREQQPFENTPALRQRIKSAIGLSRMARRQVGGDGAYRTRVALDMALIELAKEMERLKSANDRQ